MAKVTRSERGKPILKVLSHLPPLGRNVGGNNAEVKIEPEGENQGASQESRVKQIQDLHRKFAHAKGKRLYATLKEYNLLDDYTLKECNDVDCATCSLLNMRKSKIPRTADASKGKLEVGELTMQDLTMMPEAFDGTKYMSVIIDVRSRFISLMAIRRKDQALQHSVAYINKMRGLGHKIVKWHTDNGGEFLGNEYENTIVQMGISHKYGAPQTPESQGVVERANGTIKRLMGKVLRELQVPLHCWPALLPGITQQLNAVVHSSTARTPYDLVKYPHQQRLPFIEMGALVGLLDPASGEPLEGYYCGAISPQVSVVVCKTAAGRWRIVRIHPARVTRRKVKRAPIRGGDPLRPLPPKPHDVEEHDMADYDLRASRRIEGT